MNQQSKIILVQMGILFSKQTSEQLISMYDAALSDLDENSIYESLQKWVKTQNRFPSPADLRNFINPVLNEQDIGIEISSKIIQAVSKFGSHNSLQAKGFIGDSGWEVVKRSGGWENLCQELNEENRGMLTAQMRELAKTVVKIKTKENYEIKNNPALEDKTVDVKNLLANLSFGEIK